MQRHPESTRVRMCLAASAHFRALPAEDLDRVAGLCRVSALEDGRLLYHPRSELDRFWIVLSGSLRIFSTDEGDEFVYALLGPGAFFGLSYLLSRRQLAVAASAYGATEVAAVDGASFLGLLDRSPRLWRHVGGLLADRLSMAMMVIRDLSNAPLRKRIVRRLLGQAISRDLGAGTRIELRVTQSDLAAMLGTSRSKMNAELKQLEKERLIEVGYRILVLANLEGLREIAGPDLFAF